MFRILRRDSWTDIPLDEVRPFIRKGCLLCRDMTAEWSDISVGAAEGIEGWNTVLVRTPRGRDLLRSAQEDGILEIGDLPEENLDHLREASLNKWKRGEQAREETGAGGGAKT